MIKKCEIEPVLILLKKLYDGSVSNPDTRLPILYSKMAIIEYCGWLEEGLDKIVLRSMKDRLKTQQFKNQLNSTIEITYGFQYKKHFRPMLVKSAGLQRAEALQEYLDASGNLDILTAELEAVRIDRNTAAHTHLEGVSFAYSSPSIIIQRMKIVCPIMKDIYRYFCK